MAKVPSSESLHPATLRRLSNIFEKHGWDINPETENTQGYEEIFGLFSEMLVLLDADEQELVLRLTEDYLHCTYFHYPSLLRRVLLRIPDELIEQSEAVFIIPLKDPDDRGKVKSSEQLLYSLRHLVIPKLPKLNAKVPVCYPDPELLLNHTTRTRSLILMVDDFVGTGRTAEAALSDYSARLKVADDVVIVLSLVAQLEGIELIESLGFSAIAAHYRRKCISDNDKIVDKATAIQLMKRIESRIPIDAYYSLGYEKSEALVTMISTPDNTLPIYWNAGKVAAKSWPAPFRRTLHV